MSTRDPDVPRLPRGRGISLSTPQIFKIIFLAALLVAVIVLTRPCAEAAGRFVGQFETPKDAGVKKQAPADDLPRDGYQIKGTTPEEIEKELKELEKREENREPATGNRHPATGNAQRDSAPE